MWALYVLGFKHFDVYFSHLSPLTVLVQDGKVFILYCFQVVEEN
jgi:hypothetical protein